MNIIKTLVAVAKFNDRGTNTVVIAEVGYARETGEVVNATAKLYYEELIVNALAKGSKIPYLKVSTSGKGKKYISRIDGTLDCGFDVHKVLSNGNTIDIYTPLHTVRGEAIFGIRTSLYVVNEQYGVGCKAVKIKDAANGITAMNEFLSGSDSNNRCAAGLRKGEMRTVTGPVQKDDHGCIVASLVPTYEKPSNSSTEERKQEAEKDDTSVIQLVKYSVNGYRLAFGHETDIDPELGFWNLAEPKDVCKSYVRGTLMACGAQGIPFNTELDAEAKSIFSQSIQGSVTCAGFMDYIEALMDRVDQATGGRILVSDYIVASCMCAAAYEYLRHGQLKNDSMSLSRLFECRTDAMPTFGDKIDMEHIAIWRELSNTLIVKGLNKTVILDTKEHTRNVSRLGIDKEFKYLSVASVIAILDNETKSVIWTGPSLTISFLSKKVFKNQFEEKSELRLCNDSVASKGIGTVSVTEVFLNGQSQTELIPNGIDWASANYFQFCMCVPVIPANGVQLAVSIENGMVHGCKIISGSTTKSPTLNTDFRHKIRRYDQYSDSEMFNEVVISPVHSIRCSAAMDTLRKVASQEVYANYMGMTIMHDDKRANRILRAIKNKKTVVLTSVIYDELTDISGYIKGTPRGAFYGDNYNSVRERENEVKGDLDLVHAEWTLIQLFQLIEQQMNIAPRKIARTTGAYCFVGTDATLGSKHVAVGMTSSTKHAIVGPEALKEITQLFRSVLHKDENGKYYIKYDGSPIRICSVDGAIALRALRILG